jgi:general secretion pathway protein D
VVFEPDYQAPPPFTFRMDDATYQEALHALEAVSSSFLVPVTSTVAMVVRDTPQKRTEREPVMVAAIPIPERISVMEAQELIQAVQQTMEVRRISADPARHVVIVRDQVHKVMAARQILESLSRPRAQIAVDVEFLETDKTSSLTYGMNLPNQFSIVNFGNFLHNAPSVPSGFTSFLTFGGGTTLFGIGITTATTFATLAKATATNLLEAQVVTLDGQAASLHVGDHYPIVTNAYIGSASPTTTAASSQVFTPPPTINYEDLGLVLKVTPSIHEENEVTLDVDAEFKVLGASSSTAGIPVISNRKFTGKVRLKEGEWAVIAGLTQTLDSDSLTGYPGILRIPFLGRLLNQTNAEKDTTNVLLVLKPHVVSLPAWDFPLQTLWVGSDTRPLTIF